jgi:cardiolipin synthase A/B
MTIDGEWSLVGSANWDMRSLRLNFEPTVELYDPDLARKLAGIIDAAAFSRSHWRKSTSARCR